jgi:hypothetical protein
MVQEAASKPWTGESDIADVTFANTEFNKVHHNAPILDPENPFNESGYDVKVKKPQ